MREAADRSSAIVAVATAVRLVLAYVTCLSPDEAYYLSAARLGARIPDHPPLTVAMLGLTDHLELLPVELRVRSWALVASAATTLAMVHVARRRGADARGRELVAWVGSWALLPMAGGFVTTPDTALLLALALALLWERAAGPALFVGALAKVVALPLAGVVAATRAKGQALLVVGILVAAVVLRYELAFQLRHAFVAGGAWSFAGALGAAAAFAGAQLALWSPIALVLGIRGLRSAPLTDRAIALGMTGLMVASAVVRAVPPEPNWWAPAGLVLVIALGVEPMSARLHRALLVTLLVPTVIALLHTLHPFLPLEPKADPTARLHGWRHGDPPLDAAAVGPYGAAAELCAYGRGCDDIRRFFGDLGATLKAP